jgi:hypothetical protein
VHQCHMALPSRCETISPAPRRVFACMDAAGAGNLPRGLYAIDGKFYAVHFAADGHKTLSLRGVSVEKVCDELT